MQHPEEGTIHAWLDGALPASEAAAIEAHVASCDACAAAVADARGLIAASSRIVGHLDVIPGNVIPAAAPKKRTPWSRSVWPAAIAATLVIGIALAQSRRASELPSSEVIPVNQPAPAGTRVILDSTVAIAAQHVPATRPAPQRVSELKPDTSPLPPANVATQKVAAAEPQPVPLPASAPPSAKLENTELRSMAASDAGRAAMPRSSVGSVAGFGAAAPAASDQVADTSGFAGCYELVGANNTNSPTISAPATSRAPLRSPAPAPAPPQLLPGRFALVDEPAPTPGMLAIRQLDAAGRPGPVIFGAGWSLKGDRAILRDGDGRVFLTFTKSGSTVRAVTTDGSRSARAIACR
jgi:anti-sigma factor RsiW